MNTWRLCVGWKGKNRTALEWGPLASWNIDIKQCVVGKFDEVLLVKLWCVGGGKIFLRSKDEEEIVKSVVNVGGAHLLLLFLM